MNKTRVVVGAVCISLIISLVGCKKAEKAGPPPTGPVELKLKWPKGSRTVQNLDLKQTAEVRAAGMPAPIQQQTEMGQRFQTTVLNERGDGGHEVELEFLSVRMKSGAGNRTLMEFDSASKSPGTNPVAQIFEKIIGTRIRLFMDSSNEVWNVEGTKELEQQLASVGTDPTGILKSLFSEDYFKQMMSWAKGLPPGPVGPGDSWPVVQEIPMGDLGTMITDYKYTLKSWERRDEHNCARIEFTGTIKTKPGKSPKITGMTIMIEGGDSSGETWFDLERGSFVDTTVNQDLKMFITVPNPGRGNGAAAGKPITLTNQMHQLITIKADPAK